MPQDNRQLAPQHAAPPQQLTAADRTAKLLGYLESRKDQIGTLTGGDKGFASFKAVVSMALHKSPDLLDANPKSFVDACLQCASDGLVPDGRQAALAIFKGEVSYMPMVRGIVLCMYRTNMVADHEIDVVYAGEHFVYEKGLKRRLEHRPDPKFRQGDENITWAYVVIRTIAGGLFFHAMTKAEVDRIRAIAKTQKVWAAHYAEMAKKTVLRNLSKSLPFDLEVASRDDDMYDLDAVDRPAVKTVLLKANPEDRIEDDVPEQPPAPAGGQQQTKATEPKDDPLPPPVAPPAPPQEPEQQIQDAVVEELPQVGEPDPPSDSLELSDAGQKLRQWIIDQIGKLTTAEQLTTVMEKAFGHSAWPDIVAAGKDKPLFQIIQVTEAFNWLDVGSEIYTRIKG